MPVRKQGLAPDFLTNDEWAAIVKALRLSNRQRAIVETILGGGTEGHIADQLGISQHTVHSYMARLYAKLGVSSRTAVVVRVFTEYVRLFRTT